jgi:uncharacterized membrane protein YeaQ/YmgE (transglycosylase-associated protein family)
MLLLSLLWLLLGIIIGLLALAAHLRLPTWGRLGWLIMLAFGALTALIGGWLGDLLLGRFATTPTALWVAILGVVLLSRGTGFLGTAVPKRGAGCPRFPFLRPPKAGKRTFEQP